MKQLNFHNSDKSIHTNLPIIQRLVSTYKLWDNLRNHFPKNNRYTLGAKIDNSFLDVIELLFLAQITNQNNKLPTLQKASSKLDLLKFFLQITWELKVLDNKKYIILSKPLNEIGRMLGGWLRTTEKKTPAN